MSETFTLTFEFNSALTKLDEKTGTFDEKAFRESVLPIRGKLMSIDGMTGCHIFRYAVEVTFIPTIVPTATIDSHVPGCFEWASQNNFFPFLTAENTLKVWRKIPPPPHVRGEP